MNLASKISYDEAMKDVYRFLRSIQDKHIILLYDYTDFNYHFSHEHFTLLLSVRNTLQSTRGYVRDRIVKEQWVDMLLEGSSRVKLSISFYECAIRKEDYPVDVLGLFSKEFLLLKDNSAEEDKYHFTLDTTEDVIAYLCIVHDYNNSLFN